MPLRQEGPLAGIAIAELGGEIATRYCARLFARLGAEVWRAADADDGLDPLFAAWLDQGKQVVPDPTQRRSRRTERDLLPEVASANRHPHRHGV